MFSEKLAAYDFETVKELIYSQTTEDIERVLSKSYIDDNDLPALLSPLAGAYLEEMAQRAHELTVERFGRTIQIYAPLYLSNECGNACLYCGFSADNKGLRRRTLSPEEIRLELEAINRLGIRHILLVSGEAPAKVGLDYLRRAIEIASGYASFIGIEVYPLSVEGYRTLAEAGATGLTIYQETYDKERYALLHKGKKADMVWRLDAPDRGGIAGLRTIGVGPLLGLSDPRTDVFFALLHATYLTEKYWRSQITISFPRIRKAEGSAIIPIEADDKMLVQFITAARLLLHDVGLVISTRESPALRDRLVPLGLTQMSAASVTEPGGYTEKNISTPQFTVEDERSVEEFSAMLKHHGYEPVMKDWDGLLLR